MRHLVVYTFGMGVGNADVNFRHFPPTMKDIRDAEREIRNINGFEKNPVIVNWLEIAEDS